MSFIIDDQTRAIMCQRTTQSLCFYGGKFTNENVEKFISYSSQIIESLGGVFDILTLTPKNGDKSRDYKFSLQKLKEFFTPSQFSIVSAYKIWKTEWLSDYKIDCSFSKEFAIITFADEKINLNLDEVRNLLLNLARMIQSPYNIYFEVSYANIPSMFAGGIVADHYYKFFLLNSPENTAEKGLRFCRWANTGLPEKIYLRGVIRDVYQLNLLCKAQAYFLFEGKPFIDCVQSGKVGGTIEEITPEQFLWTVPKNEIPNVTEQCDKAGFLFNQLKDVPGDILWDDPDVAEYHKGDTRRAENGKIIKKFLDATMNNEKPDPNDFLSIFAKKNNVQ
jgi:hypothetical protein